MSTKKFTNAKYFAFLKIFDDKYFYSPVITFLILARGEHNTNISLISWQVKVDTW